MEFIISLSTDQMFHNIGKNVSLSMLSSLNRYIHIKILALISGKNYKNAVVGPMPPYVEDRIARAVHDIQHAIGA